MSLVFHTQYCIDDNDVLRSDEVIKVISDVSCFRMDDIGEIIPSTRLDDLFIDNSFTIIGIENILITLENKFDLVEITRGSEITTVGDIIELVAETIMPLKSKTAIQ